MLATVQLCTAWYGTESSSKDRIPLLNVQQSLPRDTQWGNRLWGRLHEARKMTGNGFVLKLAVRIMTKL